jgi:hypothetical protein
MQKAWIPPTEFSRKRPLICLAFERLKTYQLSPPLLFELRLKTRFSNSSIPQADSLFCKSVIYPALGNSSHGLPPMKAKGTNLPASDSNP